MRERYIGLGFVFIWSKITRTILTFREEATWWFGLITTWQTTSQLWKLKMDFRCWNHKHKINWENFLNILICLGVSPGIPSVWYWGLQTISKVENKNLISKRIISSLREKKTVKRRLSFFWKFESNTFKFWIGVNFCNEQFKFYNQGGFFPKNRVACIFNFNRCRREGERVRNR